MINRNDYLDALTHSIQALARDLEELAPDLVGSAGLITNFEIHLKFPSDGLPTIELIREHFGKNYLKYKNIERETEKVE